MTCAWQELKSILPLWISKELDKGDSEGIQEIRLRLRASPEIVLASGSQWLDAQVDKEDISFCINTASRYSPWAAQSMASGYLTAPGGHRIGICGEAVIKEGVMAGIRQVTSLCIRVARDFPGIGAEAAKLDGSILIIGAPGTGKTTLLRDILRQLSKKTHVAVVDERGELFLDHFDRGTCLDVLRGCPKRDGIELLLRTMGPQCIAVDEITASEDCDALLQAGWCGVRLIATAHAGSVRDLLSRPLYRPILESRLFDHVLVLGRDKRWREERVVM